MAEELSQEDIDALLAGGSGGGMDMLLSGTPQPVQFEPIAPLRDGKEEPSDLDLLYDVELDVKIELGRTHMSVNDILHLREGAVVQLEKDAGAPVDILINDRLVAFGEVLVLNDYFCVRVTEILSDKDRAVLHR